MNPFFMFDSVLTQSQAPEAFAVSCLYDSVHHTSENASYPMSNAFGWSWDALTWRGNTTSTTYSPEVLFSSGGAAFSGDQTHPQLAVDTVIIAGHNAYNHWKTLQLLGSDVGTTGTWGSALWAGTPSGTTTTTWANTEVIVGALPAVVNKRYFLLQFQSNSSTPVELSMLLVGRRLSLPWTPAGLDANALDWNTEWAQNDYGQFLGAYFKSWNKQISLSVPAPGIRTNTFFNTVTPNFDTNFLTHAKTNPFFFCPAYDARPVAFFSKLNGPIASPFVDTINYRSLSLKLDCYIPAS